jgi:membrane dipeptidase
VQFTLQQIDLSHRLRAAYPDRFSESVDSEQALADFKKGKLISPLGIEGLHQIGNSVANLRRFHSMGVLYATLTHNCHNRFADAAILENPLRKAEPKWNGVSQEGRRLIREMNRMGMLVDISHARLVITPCIPAYSHYQIEHVLTRPKRGHHEGCPSRPRGLEGQ